MKSTITALQLADMHVSENNLHQIEPALKQIEEIHQDLKPDLVVFAGDAWVRRGSFTAHEEFIFKSFILNLAERSKVLLIPGNHDQVNRWDRMDSITGVFTRQTNSKRIPIHKNLIVAALPKILPIKLGDRFYQIFTLPHPSKYLFLANKPGSGQNLEESIALQAHKMISHFARKIKQANGPLIMVGHGTIKGGVSESEMELSTETDVLLDHNWLPKNCLAYMWGHLHKPQEVGPVVYCGAPAPLTFGQEKLQPSVVSWQLDPEGKSEFTRIPLRVAHQLMTVELGPEDFKTTANPLVIISANLKTVPADSILRLRLKIGEQTAKQIRRDELVKLLDSSDIAAHKIVYDIDHSITARIPEITTDYSVNKLVQQWSEVKENSASTTADLVLLAEDIENQLIRQEPNLNRIDYQIKRIRAHNYKPLGEIDLDFRKLGKIVCITGENHVGKSQLVELERFAFWKIMRPQTKLVNTVRQGSPYAEVQVWFTAQDQQYRLERSVKLIKQGAKSTLVLSRQGKDGNYQPLCGENSQETQAYLETLVGTYSLYRATRFSSQTDIDYLCGLKPSELKDTLQEAINIALYDKRRNLAKEELKELENKAQLCQIHIDSFDRLEPIKEKTARQLKDHQNELQSVERLLVKKQADLKELERQYQEDRKSRQQLENLFEHKGQLIQKCDSCRTTLAEQNQGLPQKKQIEAGLRRAAKLRLQFRAALKSESKRNRILAANQTTRNNLQNESVTLKNKIGQLTGEISLIKADHSQVLLKHDLQMDQLKAKIAALSQIASTANVVPCATLPINSECQLLTQAHGAQAKLKSLKTKLKKLAQQKPDDSAYLEKLKQFDAKRKRTKSRQIKLAAELTAINQQEAEKLKHLGPIVSIELLELQLKEEEQNHWQKQQQELAAAQLAIKSLKQELTKLDQELKQLVEEENGLLVLVDPEFDWQKKIDIAQGNLDGSFKLIKSLAQQVGGYEGELNYIESAEAKAVEARGEQKIFNKRIALLYHYIEAVSRNGIPYLLLERALPQFEAYANEFLCVDDGFQALLKVKINSIKEIANGETRDEVLITFIDDRGVHPLGEASGWQKTAVGYALRAAMGKLNANLTGTIINHCIFDEGWGVCDQNNQLIARKMIQRFGQEYGQFLYITHVEALKELAQDTIVLTAANDGTVIELK